jgi:HSP20 family molecular chaperone IbpA
VSYGIGVQMDNCLSNIDSSTVESVKAAQRTMIRSPLIYRSPSLFLRNLDKVLDDLDSESTKTSSLMCCDITETSGRYFLTAELPGLTKGEFDITVNKDLLTVKVTKVDTSTVEGHKDLLRERDFGRASKYFIVPSDFISTLIHASWRMVF